MSVRRLLQEMDSAEIAEWFAYDQRWPLPDPWGQTARICRVIMSASGNYKKHDIPDEAVFIPAVVKAEQNSNQILSEMMKLNAPLPG
jgi:hypothetical protein